jgi:S1-C subfamily serine protease
VTSVDWIAIAVIGLSAFLGWRRGLIGSALSLAGVVVGAMAGARIAPHLLHGGSRSPYTPVAALVGATLGAGILQTVAMLLSSLARGSLRLTPLRVFDSIGGLVVGTAAGVAIVWVLGAAAILQPQDPGLRRAAQRSQIVSRLNNAVSPRRILNAVARIDPFQSLSAAGPAPAPPDPSVTGASAIGAAAHSVVRVTGTACGVGVEGSGWVARPNLVVTAAHVVAGETDTQVETWDGSQVLPAQVVRYDAHDDVAVLRVPGLGARPLPLAGPRSGAAAALIGYPGNGGLTATPVRVGVTRTVLTQDAYGNGPVARTVTILSGSIRHGDSGGPIVDANGAVQATVFARRPGPPSGLAVPSDLVRRELARVGVGAASTGACAAG